jgi:hypothetical protein
MPDTPKAPKVTWLRGANANKPIRMPRVDLPPEPHRDQPGFTIRTGVLKEKQQP